MRDAELVAGAERADRDLATVGDQHLAEHGGLLVAADRLRDSAISAERYRAALDRTRANATRWGTKETCATIVTRRGCRRVPPAYAAAFADGRRLGRRPTPRPPGGRTAITAIATTRGAPVVFAIVAVLVALTIASDGGVLLIGGGC